MARTFTLGGLLRATLPRQIFPQNHHGGNGIHGVFSLSVTDEPALAVVRGFMGDAPAQLFFQDALGLPTGQAFVDHFDGDADLFAKAVGKARGFLGHVAVRAVEAQGQTDNDLLHVDDRGQIRAGGACLRCD